MIIEVTFPGGKRVDATFGRHVLHTDQSTEHGGTGSAPEPFELFLASLATCAGAYVAAFCDARQIPTADLRLTQRASFNDVTRLLERVVVELDLPPTFPEKYRAPLVRAVEGCKVKKTLASPPPITVEVRTHADPPIRTEVA